MHMQLCGKGLQYRVYDIGNGRVRKIPTTLLQKFTTLLSWGVINPLSIHRSIRDAEKMTKDSTNGLRSRVNDENCHMLGNPVFSTGLDYEQDKATPLAKYFEEHDLEENKRIIDLYIEQVLHLWHFGISDAVFNFTINNGVTRSGEVLLLDLGELVFSKQEVATFIASEKWLTQWSYKQLNKDLKPFFKEEMTQRLTLAALEEHWCAT